MISISIRAPSQLGTRPQFLRVHTGQKMLQVTVITAAVLALTPVFSSQHHCSETLEHECGLDRHDVFSCSEYHFDDMASWACAESVSEPKYVVTMCCFVPPNIYAPGPICVPMIAFSTLVRWHFVCCDSFLWCVFLSRVLRLVDMCTVVRVASASG